ncbi:hypothetical protein [uncultured Rummeliibacillus sp.]|uniref:hypothetical protein n=1 Tax=uncultured Rummeliibacillus sp. TaxID=762292 RepID=UPI00262BB51B|nr:hypothetical protein [uncultured Rummeliibacillus sp.]
MAFGIMQIGLIQKFAFYNERIETSLAILLFGAYGCIISLLLMDIKKGAFYNNHLKDPINSFTIGTWVAATSVIILNITYHFPHLTTVSIGLYIIDFLIWLFYLGIIIRNYSIYIRKPKFIEKLNGVIVLSCVSTQSLVIGGETIFKAEFPIEFAFLLIVVGATFYVISLMLIGRSLYLMKNTLKTVILNWKMTNCTIHGGLSITGLALIVTFNSSGKWLIYYWIFVTIVFFIVESIEGTRSIFRIQQFGIKDALFIYHPTQWVRNFTFGMYVNFTIHLPAISLLGNARTIVIEGGKYIVVSLFIIEVCLLAQYKLGKRWD